MSLQHSETRRAREVPETNRGVFPGRKELEPLSFRVEQHRVDDAGVALPEEKKKDCSVLRRESGAFDFAFRFGRLP